MSVVDAPWDDASPAVRRRWRSRAKESLHFARTAPRHLVDRSAVTQVLVTDWRRLGADTFRIGAQWPRDHSFYTPVADSWHDPLLGAESLRQAAFLIGRHYYGAPTGQAVVVDELDIETAPSAMLLGRRPTEISMDITCTDVRHDGHGIAGLTVNAELLRDDVFLGAGRLALRFHSPEAHRTDACPATPADGLPPQPDPLPAPIAGRLREHDVVLGVAGGSAPRHTWQLRVDPGHPVLFDQPAHHVPCMVLLEAARQGTQAVCAPYRILPLDIRSAFHEPVELGLPCQIAATRLPTQDASEDTAVRVTGLQEGRLVFDSLVLAGLCD
ncbi:hypothetical protein N566_25290 [Streptomycetaceae bacterium MP113-05]|nr:hypothetical protein N566_25290 [Streptomycetaceae bacterium MP113-05]